jgi:Tfp pilus assembly protein PilP
MRLAMISKVLLLSLSVVLTTGLAAQEHPNINPSTVRGELQQAGQAPRAPAKAQAPAKAPAAQRPARAPVERPEAAPVARRDPFEAVVNSLRVDGIVKGPNGMIAVVSNPQQRVYFLREGDKLYDGSVERITLEAVSFHEVGKDAFGKPIERQVTKRLYPSPGEQP